MVVNHNMASICESRQLRYNVKKMEVSSKSWRQDIRLLEQMMMRRAYRFQRQCAIRLED